MLSRLCLGKNSIGKIGAKHLAESLFGNTVIYLMAILVCHTYVLLMKTLSIIELGCNEIGNEGTKYLADVLQHNTVSLLRMLSQLLSHIDTRHTGSSSKQHR
jgi:hypothetical protein